MYKVSGTGWLCFRESLRDNWIPIFKLTPEQIQCWAEFQKEFLKQRN